MEENDDNLIVELGTTQAIRLRCLFETLSQLVVDANVLFTSEGMFMKALTHDLLVSLDLKSTNIEHYTCTQDTICGVSFDNFHKCCKNVNQEDVICLKVFRDKFLSNHPRVDFIVKNKEHQYHYDEPLLYIKPVRIDIPKTEFDCTFTMTSVTFQRMLRCAERKGGKLQILARVSPAGTVIYFVVNDNESTKGKLVTRFMTKNYNPSIKPGKGCSTPSEILIGDATRDCDKRDQFDLKVLTRISHATNMSQLIKLCLSQTKGFPLMLEYSVGTLGTITFYLDTCSVSNLSLAECIAEEARCL